jgi:hypothetical protein
MRFITNISKLLRSESPCAALSPLLCAVVNCDLLCKITRSCSGGNKDYCLLCGGM